MYYRTALVTKLESILPQETVSGTVVVESRSETRHDGITLTMDGVASIQLSPKSAGLIESIVNSSKVKRIDISSIESNTIIAHRKHFQFVLLSSQHIRTKII